MTPTAEALSEQARTVHFGSIANMYFQWSRPLESESFRESMPRKPWILKNPFIQMTGIRKSKPAEASILQDAHLQRVRSSKVEVSAGSHLPLQQRNTIVCQSSVQKRLERSVPCDSSKFEKSGPIRTICFNLVSLKNILRTRHEAFQGHLLAVFGFPEF